MRAEDEDAGESGEVGGGVVVLVRGEGERVVDPEETPGGRGERDDVRQLNGSATTLRQYRLVAYYSA